MFSRNLVIRGEKKRGGWGGGGRGITVLSSCIWLFYKFICLRSSLHFCQLHFLYPRPPHNANYAPSPHEHLSNLLSRDIY